MILSLKFDLPDGMSDAEIAAYIRSMADSAASQIEQKIIDVPDPGFGVYIDYDGDRVTWFNRSE